MKTNTFSFLHYNRFSFGEQIVSQFVLFECKYLFSIILFYFHKSDKAQDRFHTHAFNAISFKLFGRYTEYILNDDKSYYTIQRTDVVKYFPRNSYHKIGNSTGCATILFSGIWKPTWKEYKDGVETTYQWNRNSSDKNH